MPPLLPDFMDKNSVIGLLLIAAILIGYTYMTAPTQEEIEQRRIEREMAAQAEKAEQATQDDITATEANVSAEIAVQDTLISDSLQNVERIQNYGVFANASVGELSYFQIENELMILTLSNKGGRIVNAELKDYKRYDSSALLLFDEWNSRFSLDFFTAGNKNITTDSLYFSTDDESFSVTGEDVRTFKFRAYAGSRDKFLEFAYTMRGNDFMVDFELSSNGLQPLLARNQEEFELNWMINAPSQEKSMELQRQATTVYYKYVDQDIDYISETSDDKEDLEASVQWIAFKQQYFTAAIIAEDHFDKYNAVIETKTDEESKYVKRLSTRLSVPTDFVDREPFKTSFYLGPNHFQTMSSYDMDLERLIPLGPWIFGWVNRIAVIPIFNWLDNYILSYGIIILILTIIIKLVLFPITYKTYVSSAKMRVLKPEITEISEKHKDDPMKKQQATMNLYRQAGVNPLAGCIPLLIQMPILFAMFRFFPASIELRQKSFLWADDLSTYDSILELPFEIPLYGSHVSLFTLLMAISMIFYTRMNNNMGMGGAGGEAQMAQMKIIMYLMPVMMLFFFNRYSSGLSYYYLVANVVTMAQQFAIKNWIIDEDKIHKQIQANKKRPASAKKSRFQKRLEEMAKQKGYKPQR